MLMQAYGAWCIENVLRALTNDSTLILNPLQINDLHDYLWDVSSLSQCEESLTIYEDGWRPWARFKGESDETLKFYEVHDRNKDRDMAILCKFKVRSDIAEYTVILQKVLSLFGAGSPISLSRLGRTLFHTLPLTHTLTLTLAVTLTMTLTPTP
jgi:hypothetical protein